jgi:hypothetical protein
MTEDKDSWLELLEIRDADAAVWELVVACPQCRMWQAFRGLNLRSGTLPRRGRTGISAPAHADARGAAALRRGRTCETFWHQLAGPGEVIHRGVQVPALSPGPKRDKPVLAEGSVRGYVGTYG